MRAHYFRFSGATGEYFKIWLVNILLTLLTLGAFSAWAKVRSRRYFYGNLFLMDNNFDYHASPWSILIARVILLTIVVGGAIWAGEDALRNAEYSLLLFALLPWALVRGLSFNARNSSYRNARFRFSRAGSYLKMYLAYAPLIIIFFTQTLFLLTFPDWDGLQSLGGGAGGGAATILLIIYSLLFLMAPWFVRKYHATKASGHSWGQLPCAFEAPLAPYYKVALLYPLYVAALSVGVLVISWGALAVIVGDSEFVSALMFLLIYMGYFMMLRAQLFKLYWENIRLPQGGRVVCGFSAMQFGVGILLVNFILTLLSLGLLYPWAAIRRARFLAAHMSVEMDEAVLTQALSVVEKEGAFGEEFDAAEGFDFDVALV